VEYNGSKGVDLYTIENPNRPGAGNVYLGDSMTTSPLSRLRTTQYSNINRRGFGGFSHYNSVDVRAELTNIGNTGLSLHTSYTYAHAIDNISSTFSESSNNGNLGLLDPFNPKLDKGNSDFDLRHRFVFSGTWDVPFARNMSGFKKRVFDGFTIAPIISVRTGFPFTMFDCSNAFTTCPRAFQTSKLQRAGSQQADLSGSANTFDYFVFPKGTFDSSYANSITNVSDFGPFPSNMLTRGYFYGPGAYNVDIGVYKTTKLTERLSLQLRGEFFNALNHSNLWLTLSDNDVSSITDPTTQIARVHAQKGVPPVKANERRDVQLAVKLIF
jgi:hypothetical protein